MGMGQDLVLLGTLGQIKSMPGNEEGPVEWYSRGMKKKKKSRTAERRRDQRSKRGGCVV